MSLTMLFLSTFTGWTLFIFNMSEVSLFLLLSTFLFVFIIQEKIKILRYLVVSLLLMTATFIFMGFKSDEIADYLFLIELILNISLIVEMICILVKEKYEKMVKRQEVFRFLPIYLFDYFKINISKKK